MMKVIKKYLIAGLVALSLLYNNTYALTSDDLKFFSFSLENRNQLYTIYNVPAGYDLIIENMTSESSNIDWGVYDNGVLITNVGGDYSYSFKIVIKDRLDVIRYNGRDGYNYTISGYIVAEGGDLGGLGNIQITQDKYTGTDYIIILQEFLTHEEFWTLTVLYLIYFMNIYMLWLCVKWSFKAGKSFFNNLVK